MTGARSAPARRFRISRTIALAGLAAFCVASAPTLVAAASLKGKPFLLDPDYKGADYQYALLFNYGGGFAATFAAGAGGASQPNELSYKTFTKTGKADVKKTLIAKGTPGPWDEVLLQGAGGFHLGDDRSLIGFVDNGYFNNDKAVGGLFGRIVKDGKPQGEKRAFDNSKKNRTDFGSIIAVSGQRGLAYWRTYDEGAGTYTSGARFIGGDGAPDGKPIDLTRAKSELVDVIAFGSGFVTLQRKTTKFPLQSLFVQIYDEDGKKVGKEGVITEDTDLYENQYPKLLTISKDRFVFLSSRPADAGPHVHGQIFDGEWEKVGGDKVLVEKMADGFFVATSLPGGDIIVASVKGEENGTEDGTIEIRRFGKKLKQSGPTAKSEPLEYKTFLTQIIALKSGDAVLSYSPKGGKLTAQIIKP